MIMLNSRPAGHFYKDNQKRLYPSVTTILSSVKNENLEAWKARTCNWRQISGEACRVGSAVHKNVEDFLNRKPTPIRHKIPFQAFLDWNAEYKLKILKTEMKVRSPKNKYAGSLDVLGFIEGDLYVIDIKTSARIYDNFCLQLSAYKAALIEMGERRNINTAALRLDKYTGKFEFHIYNEDEYNQGIKEFLALCKTWHKDHNTRVEFNKKFVLDE